MNAIKIIAKTYLPAILIFGFFRLILFFFHRHEVFSDGISDFSDVLNAFFNSLRYDLMTASYLLLIPYFLLIAHDYTRKLIWKKIAFWWTFIMFFLGFMLAAANVIYYNKFYQFINLKTFEWFDDPVTVTGMIFQEPRYWWMFVPFFVITYLFYRLLKKIYQSETAGTDLNYHQKIFFYTLFFSMIFLTMRGRIGSHPLRIQDAFSLHNNFLNELKLNPVFVLEKSLEGYFKDKLHPLKLMEPETAVKKVQEYLHITQPVTRNPISRKIEFNNPPTRKNVVLILMESMAAWKLKYFGNTENRTPFIDSLFLQGIAFSNMYSNGTHTYCGIYGINFGYPLIFDKHPFKGAEPKIYYGLPQVLKEKGYQTAFFIPHDKGFDNLGAFLSKNAYDKIYFEKDYPSDSIRTIWGVDDHFLLNFALKKIDKMDAKNKPFLATILTISDHGPFYIPDYIQGETEKIRATRFADYSLHDFFRKARQKPWFDHTVFIFVADHGEPRHGKYPMPLTYNHIPAIIYYQGVQPQIIDKPAGQVDIFPTLMHVLQTPYINQTFGIDLFIESRPYIFFNHDKKYGLIDREHLLVIDPHKTIGLYKYTTEDMIDYKDKLPAKTSEMETYLKAHIQAAKYILDKDLQAPPEK